MIIALFRAEMRLILPFAVAPTDRSERPHRAGQPQRVAPAKERKSRTPALPEWLGYTAEIQRLVR